MTLKDRVAAILGHLGAARAQRAPSDDTTIAEHVDFAYNEAVAVFRQLDQEDRSAR